MHRLPLIEMDDDEKISDAKFVTTTIITLLTLFFIINLALSWLVEIKH